MPYILGIDAGGSHTRCAVADESGTIVSLGLGGPANINFIALESAHSAVKKALSEALGPIFAVADAVVITGAHLPPAVSGLVSQMAQTDNIITIDEFEACIAAGLHRPGGHGFVVVSGTGSFAKGRNAGGEVKYAGGWGSLIGDEGSAFDIAREGLVAIARALDGRGPETDLMEFVFSALGTSEPGEIRKRLYDPPIERHKFAVLSKCVFEAAEIGDPTALEILRRAGIRLAELAAPVARGLFGPEEKFPAILSGGVPRAGGILANAFASEMTGIRANADAFVSELQPVTGALIFGLDSIGVQANADVIENLRDGDAKIREITEKSGE